MTQTTGFSRLSRPHLLLVGVLCTVLVAVIGVNLFRRYQQAALFRAAEQGNPLQLQALLRGGADPNAARRYFSNTQGNIRESPLLLAARGSHWQAVRLLLEAGADPNFRNGGESTLGYAVAHQQTDLVRDLLRRHADVNGTTRSGSRILYAAVASGNREIVQALLEAGGDANTRDGLGSLALSEAVRQNRADIVRLLLAHGANVNARDHNHSRSAGGPSSNMGPLYREGRYNPLMWAVWYGNKPMVELLLAHGASPRIKWTPLNTTRFPVLTPLKVAVYQKRQEIAALLRKAGANE